MNSCFVCPLYMKERDYNYALQMCESKIECNIKTPIYFVFSYKTHEEHFKKLFFDKFGYELKETILVPEEYLKYKCQVTTKKLYAIHILQDQFKYIATIDCECKFVREKNVDEVFEDIWNKKSFMKCNRSYLLQHLLKNCVENLELENKEKIRKETDNYVYNCWFNEIPVYNTQYTHQFFQWFDTKKDAILDNYFMVDYYVYLLYLLDKSILKISKMNYWAPLGIMEEVAYTHKNHAMEIESEIGTHWTSNPDYSNPEILMQFHLDHKPSVPEIKDFIGYSKYKYVVWKLVPNNKVIQFWLERVADKIWKTEYYKKYRW